VDVAVHDVLIGTQEAFIFRAGPLSLMLSAQTPTDDIEPYKSKMQVELKSLRVLYGLSAYDMECDLTEVVSETAFTFFSEDSMPQDLSGATKEQKLEISDTGMRLEVSLKELLFLKALQKTLATVDQGIAGLEALAQVEQQDTQQSSAKVSRQFSERARSMRIGLESLASGSQVSTVKVKFQRNIAKLTRCFKCPSIELHVIDDLPDAEEQDAHAGVSKVKLMLCRMSDIEVSETLGDMDANVSASIASFHVQAQAVGDTSDMETLLEPFPLQLKISTSRFSKKQEMVFEIPSGLEMTITPDHVQRPNEAKGRFDRHAKKKQLLMKLTLKANIQAGLKMMAGEVEPSYREKMFMFLSSLSHGEKRQICNRTDLPILCRIYPAADCNTLKRPLMQFVLPAGGSVKAPAPGTDSQTYLR
jgi:hypothetical protein